MRARWTYLVALGVLAAACTDSASSLGTTSTTEPSTADAASTTARPSTTAAPTTAASTATTAATTVAVGGVVVSAVDGSPLADALVTIGDASAWTASDGSFELTGVAPGDPVSVERPVWMPATIDWPENGSEGELVVELEPRVVRALRVSRFAAGEPERFETILDLADQSTVNALVFDTKDETGDVLYKSNVPFANSSGAVEAVYEPQELLARARAEGLYSITRIVTFEDSPWATFEPEAALAGAWVDAANRDNWEYPLALAAEACELGFDEVQFDYVRFPAGQTAIAAAGRLPATGDERAAAIGDFLAEARARLHPQGCGVSAAIFGIVSSSATDEGIGQTPEAVSASVDAVSPMLYPSHYGPGWLGFADPNEHPGPVIAHALDSIEGRMAPGALVRPWIQGFYYGGAEVLAQIDEAEARGAGWIIWNASGTYAAGWLPPSSSP